LSLQKRTERPAGGVKSLADEEGTVSAQLSPVLAASPDLTDPGASEFIHRIKSALNVVGNSPP
jgi:hypothetical protein